MENRILTFPKRASAPLDDSVDYDALREDTRAETDEMRTLLHSVQTSLLHAQGKYHLLMNSAYHGVGTNARQEIKQLLKEMEKLTDLLLQVDEAVATGDEALRIIDAEQAEMEGASNGAQD